MMMFTYRQNYGIKVYCSVILSRIVNQTVWSIQVKNKANSEENYIQGDSVSLVIFTSSRFKGVQQLGPITMNSLDRT